MLYRRLGENGVTTSYAEVVFKMVGDGGYIVEMDDCGQATLGRDASSEEIACFVRDLLADGGSRVEIIHLHRWMLYNFLDWNVVQYHVGVDKVRARGGVGHVAVSPLGVNDLYIGSAPQNNINHVWKASPNYRPISAVDFPIVPCGDCGRSVVVADDWPSGEPVWCLSCYNKQMGGEVAL